ncbi:MAG: hypothetical protein J3K34DRAFT_224636 [Monoraphidium minutum]|nr:MAG: hypothetical protein J3K34DRAFT_224636 [Monoraphidium minutum]
MGDQRTLTPPHATPASCPPRHKHSTQPPSPGPPAAVVHGRPAHPHPSPCHTRLVPSKTQTLDSTPPRTPRCCGSWATSAPSPLPMPHPPRALQDTNTRLNPPQDPPLPWFMGDQRILNPDIRVGTAFDRMVGGNADLMVTLMTTFRYSRYVLLPTREAIHLVLHQEAQPKDIVTAYLQACILRKRLKTGLPASPDNLPELRIVLHDTMLWVPSHHQRRAAPPRTPLAALPCFWA